MNNEQFTYWLEGFLVGKTTLDNAQLTEIRTVLKDVYTKNVIPPNYPTQTPSQPTKINPMCDSGKQLLTDSNWPPKSTVFR